MHDITTADDRTPRIGSLFSGYGGLDLAVERTLNAETVWFSKIHEPIGRVFAHHWPEAPNLGDVTRIVWSEVEPVDVLCRGFACQNVPPSATVGPRSWHPVRALGVHGCRDRRAATRGGGDRVPFDAKTSKQSSSGSANGTAQLGSGRRTESASGRERHFPAPRHPDLVAEETWCCTRVRVAATCTPCSGWPTTRPDEAQFVLVAAASRASGRSGSNSSTGFPDGSSTSTCLPPTPVTTSLRR